MKYRVTVKERTFEIEITPDGQVWVDHKPLDVDFEGVDELLRYSLLVDNRSYETHVDEGAEGYSVIVKGRPYQATICNGHQAAAKKPAVGESVGDGPVEVAAPLPGMLLELRVAEGEEVEKGQVMAVLDTMKMHLELCAPCTGMVDKVGGNPMSEVSQGDTLVVITPTNADSPGD